VTVTGLTQFTYSRRNEMGTYVAPTKAIDEAYYPAMRRNPEDPLSQNGQAIQAVTRPASQHKCSCCSSYPLTTLFDASFDINIDA
jgi:hypothetical protein